ncbi:MAG: WG repeat-containing protein [Tannerellaceae bacterium]|nr:WG repeat-containing protein [Tannerellaceae bacterium]
MQLKQGTSLQGGKDRYHIINVLGQNSLDITYLAAVTLQTNPAGRVEAAGAEVVIREFFVRDSCTREEAGTCVSVPSADKRKMVKKLRNQFIGEAVKISGLRHPNIVRVTDVFEQNETAYYVMEYLGSCSLQRVVEEKGALPEGEALAYIRQIAYALAYIHAKQITHWDIKPEHIFRKPDHSVVLTGFGVLKPYEAQIPELPVVCAYTPSDQADGLEPFSAATDIYSLAATLYKLLTALTPPDTDSISNGALLSLPDHISKSVALAIKKAMEPLRSKRPQSIRNFLQLLYGSYIAEDPEDDEPDEEDEDDEGGDDEREDADDEGDERDERDDEADNDEAEDDDAETKEIAKPEHPSCADGMEEISPESLVRVESKGKYGYVDANGKKILPLIYKKAGDFSEGLALVKLNGKYGYIDVSGKVITWLKYDFIGDFSEDLALVKLNGKYGYIDTKGKKKISLKYDKAGDFSEGFAYVCINGKYGYINTKGKKIIPLKYDRAGNFSEGLAWVRINGKYGCIDTEGREIIPLKYDRAGNFSKGLARVELYCECGYINKRGQEVIPLKYDWIWSFTEGLAKAQLEGKCLWIDEQGNEYETEEEGRKAATGE